MNLNAKQVALRELYREKLIEWDNQGGNSQSAFTPYELCEKVIVETNRFYKLDGKKILVRNLEFAIVLIEQGNDPKDICFCTNCKYKAKFGNMIGVEIMDYDFIDFLKKVNNKEGVRTWDACLMNPPYQGDIKNNGDIARRVVISSLWEKFVELSFSILNDGGILSAIHPSQWRMGKKKFQNVWNIALNNQLHYLEMHDCNDGLKTFDTMTRYDWYVLQKTPRYKDSEICFEDGVIEEININKYPLIPNRHDQFDLFEKVICKKGDCPIKFIHSNVFYKHDKSHMAKCRDESHKYPCVKHTSKCNPISLRWSNTNRLGHFGEMKVIYGNQADIGKIVLDESGYYGLTQFVSGIGADSKSELNNIYEAITSEKFYLFMMAFQTGRVMFNNDVMSNLKREFWKEFI